MSIYSFLFIWLFFPKSVNSIPGIFRIPPTPGVEVFYIMESIAIIAICVAYAKKKRIDNNMSSYTKSYNNLKLFVVCAFIAFGYSMMLQDYAYFPAG